MIRVRAKLKGLMKDALARAGYRVVAADTSLSLPLAFDRLRAAGLAPSTILDVGVASGTPWLHDAFPEAMLHLFDPTPASRPHMEAIARRRSAVVHPIALGAAPGTMPMHILDADSGSSFFREVGRAPPGHVAEVPVRRLDDEVVDFTRPALLKIDVQGAELLVLQGAERTLDAIDVLIVEVSVIATVQGGAEVGAVVAHLLARGFVIADVIGLLRRPLDGAVAQLDLVFVPESSPLRSDRRWQADA